MKNSFLFLAIAILLMAGCTKDETADSPEEVSLIINTTLPEGLTFASLELRFSSIGVNNIPIQPGIDTITFSKEEAKELLGKNATASLLVYEPKLSGLPCQILEVLETSFIVKKINNLSWVLEVKPESTSLILVTNVVFPEIITYTDIPIIVLTEENEELVFFVEKGIDTIYFSGQQAIDLLGEYVQVTAMISNPEINGNNCFPYCNNYVGGFAHITLQAKNELEWIFVLPE